MQRYYLSRLYLGLLLLGGGALTAWSVGRPADTTPEAAPMEALLEESGSAAVTWDLPVTRNERVDEWIDFLKGRNADKTQLWLERSGRYAPMIQGELRRRGMPEDLLYLALIESGFSPRAVSSASAVGIWQFISETGRRYGLQVGLEVDERRDPIKATSAALDYLQDLYDRFGSWYLAAAAYNSGENRVDRILRERAGGARGADTLFWTIAPYLPRETRNYVPLMLAAGHIAKEPGKYGFPEIAYQEPLEFDVAWVPGGTELATVAKAAGVLGADVADLNPQLLRQRTPSGRGWAVRIPAGTKVAFAARFPTLFQEQRLAAATEAKQPAVTAVKPAAVAAKPAVTRASTTRTAALRSHKVRPGETMSGIARRYGVSLAALEKANSVNPRRLQVGQKLKVPASSGRVAAATPRVHKVQRGENLSVIASRYKVSVSDLRRWNGMSGSRIYAGQQLKVRAS